MAKPRLHTWLLAARPKTLAAGIAPVMIGSAIVYADGGFHPASAIAALVGAILIQVGTNFANDYFDFTKGTDTEARTGPVRVTQAGLVSPSTMKNATVVVFALALLDGLYLAWRGGWPVVVIGLLSIILGLLYTGGRRPLGYLGLGDILVLVFFGPVATGGTYYVQALDITPTVMLAGLAPGLFSVAILTVNNLRDIDGDRKAGKKTLAVRFGRRFAITEYAGCLVAACSLPVVLIFFTGGHLWTVLSTATILPGIRTIKAVLTGDGPALNDSLVATGRLLMIFSILFSIGWLM